MDLLALQVTNNTQNPQICVVQADKASLEVQVASLQVSAAFHHTSMTVARKGNSALIPMLGASCLRNHLLRSTSVCI